jgi:glycosyltransferase involved in cell wall biosynthesis
MSPLISLITTVYNRQHYLQAAIHSVLAQTHSNFELLIWDDGSTDESLPIAQRFTQQDRRIKVFAAPHQGRAFALQAAHAQATGDYLGWVDSDDLLAATTSAFPVPTASRKAIAQTLQRRGLAEHYDIEVQIESCFVLQKKYKPHVLPEQS